MSYKRLAETLMFGGVGASSFPLFAEHHGLQFRKGKTVADVRTAMTKALKNGRQKTEFEVGMLEVYLKQVLKPIKEETK